MPHINHSKLNERLINSFLSSPFSPVTDDESSHVHGVLTADNLFDGTISTSTEHFYIEPSHKYSKDLPKSGVHSIIYKLSDVKLNTHNRDDIDSTHSVHEPHCASERLHRKLTKENNLLKKSNSKSRLTNEKNNVNEKSDIKLNKLKLNDGVISSDNHKDKLDVVKRFKRWLLDEEVRLTFSNRH